MSGSASSQHDLPPVKIFLTSFAKRAASRERAPICSNLGRDNLFRGATRLFGCYKINADSVLVLDSQEGGCSICLLTGIGKGMDLDFT
ncbi:hypothetical protein TNCV_1686711 [Trichonephila clavipes]|nr:hypothetical protein TNCV_1686711 [Trichonephila clavipes]